MLAVQSLLVIPDPVVGIGADVPHFLPKLDYLFAK
jgi:hypothetical protein